MSAKRILAALIGYTLAGNTFSGTMGSTTPSLLTPVMSLTLGPIWTDSNKSQTINLEPDLVKTYTASDEDNTLFAGEFFLGCQRSLSSIVLGQIGLAIASASPIKLSGDIWEDADPDFNNYFYNYKIDHTHLAIKGKLLADAGQIVTPYIHGSVGVGFNRAHGFKITPKIFEEVPAPPFASKTNNSYIYTLGIGIQKPISSHWQAGIGYEFANWGKSKLNPGQEQQLNNTLVLNHLYTNQLQFSLNFVA